jgi:hypothetical protein
VGRGAALHSPLALRHLDVFTLPAFATGGPVTGFKDGVAFTDTVAANTPYKAYDKDTARRDICIVATGANDGEYGYTADLQPGRGWLCMAGGGGYAETIAHIGEVYLASGAGTTFRVNRA